MKKIFPLFFVVSTLAVTSCTGGKAKKELKEISLLGEYQTVFTYGDEFNYDGLVVNAIYTDNTSMAVTNYTVSTPVMTQIGQQDVVVSYTEEAITKNNSYQITINPVSTVTLTGITLSGDYKTQFKQNETFDYTGLVVTASYSDGTSKAVTNYTVSTPDMVTLGTKVVTVSYTEGNTTKNATYNIEVAEAVDPSYINAAKTKIRAAFNALDIENYNSNKWNAIIEMLNSSLAALDKAVSKAKVDEIVASAIKFFDETLTKEEITAGTWFDYNNSNVYALDRDEDNNLTISYDKNPGHWVCLGTRQNLITDTSVNNKLILKFRNDVDQTIQVCLQVTDDTGAYKVDSTIINVAGLETKEIVLNYDTEVTKLYFFLDSCDDSHNRSGKITILQTELAYEKRESTVIKSPKTITVNQAMTKDDASLTSYTLVDSDSPYYVERVSALVEVNFNGNGSGGRWFGLHLYAGGKHASLSSGDGYAQEFKGDDPNNPGTQVVVGARYIFNFPITSKLTSGQTISMDISYAAGPASSASYNDLGFTVKSYTLYYGLWKNVETETVNVNTTIYENGSGQTTSGEFITAHIPYSSFTKTGRVSKMTLNFTTLNTASYGKSQIYVTGFTFTNFTSGNNNVLDIGNQMDTKKTGTAVSGSVDLYPVETIDLTKSEGEITIVCWWSSATTITIDSVTMHTDNIEPPEEITNLAAHSIDQGVILTWTASLNASQYEVYMDNVLQQTVATTFATIEGLTNGESHTFGVAAKNASGVASTVTTVGEAVEGATYDMFIEGLNTPLEQSLGATNVSKVLQGSNYWLSQSNNYRLKKAINKMKNGEDTTVAYMGGSITVGETAGVYDGDSTKHQKGYAYYSYEWMKRTYDVANKSKYINASISGTGSEIGLLRAQKDVLNYNPDIIFIEFACNNGSTEFDMSSYESLIRTCMALENDPAIILMFSFTDYVDFENGTEKKLADIGAYYHLPMISFSRGMSEVCNKPLSSDPIFTAFSNDGTHPNHEGHQLYGKVVAYFISQLYARDTDERNTYASAPSQSGYDRFTSFVTVDNTMNNSIIQSLGSFYATDTSTPCTSQQSDVTAFQSGWKKTSTTENEPMVIKVNAKNFLISTECGNADSIEGDPQGFIEVTYVNDNDPTDTGTLSWDMSKTAKQNVSGSDEISYNGDGWQNPCCIKILDKNSAANYTITIKMTEATGICTIFAMGYTK